MAKQATLGDLQALHELIVQALTDRLRQDMEDNLPTDAATLGVIVKLLKDNAVTADPADSDDLSALRDKLKEQREARSARCADVVRLATTDLQVKEA